jgi:hypothetical protein
MKIDSKPSKQSVEISVTGGYAKSSGTPELPTNFACQTAGEVFFNGTLGSGGLQAVRTDRFLPGTVIAPRSF